MFKLVVFVSTLVALCSAAPQPGYGLGYGYGGGYGHHAIAVPAAVSHQSRVDYHSKPIAIHHAAPAVYAAPVVSHAYPAAVSHQSRVDYHSKPVAIHHAAPVYYNHVPAVSYASNYIASPVLGHGLYGSGLGYGLGYGNEHVHGYGHHGYGSYY